MPNAPSNLSNIPRKLDNDLEDEDERELQPIRDSLDNLDICSTPKEKQLIYDAKLKCYYDPETDEYFEAKNSS